MAGIPPLAGATPAHAAWRAQLLRLLAGDDVDGALAAGLMRFPVAAASDGGAAAAAVDADALADLPIASAQQRLREAWAARDRYRTRNARLAAREAARARRQLAQGGAAPQPGRDPSGRSVAADVAPEQAAGGNAGVAAGAGVPALPPAAAAALARAKARAANRP